MKKNAYQILIDYLIALILGVVCSIPVIFLFIIFLPSPNDGSDPVKSFLGFSLFALFLAPVLAPLIALPVTILGYLISLSYYRRGIRNVFIWVNGGFLIGILNGLALFLSEPYWIPPFGVTGAMVSYFMWRRVYI